MKDQLMQLWDERRNPRIIAASLLFLLAVVVMIYVPTTNNRRYMTIGIMTFIYIALGQSWNIGIMAGLFSVSHSTFFGLGVYGMTVTLSKFHGNVVTAILVGLMLNLILAVIIGVISSKLSGLYFIMALIGLSVSLHSLAMQWTSLTGGPTGINMPRAFLTPKRTLYFIAMGIAIASILFYTLLRRSRIGTSFVTARDNPNLASALGSNVALWKTLNIMISAGMAGLCGSFYAFHLMSNNPDILAGTYSLKVMMVCIVGGLDSVWGPVLGAIMIVLDEFMRGGMPASYAPFSVIIYAVVLIIMALARPGGLASFFIIPGKKSTLGITPLEAAGLTGTKKKEDAHAAGN
ncbi:branched-chain amino acid ABC transporter permease [Spirochaetia bacterium]|nr:branched-chain amino acid ABC transporter permease [Spirochaetia bacterium]